MTVWTRAAIVLSVVGVALVTVAGVAAVGPVRAGAPFAALVPLVLGIGLKGALALLAAGVMAHAARLERRRQRLAAETASAEGTRVRVLEPAPMDLSQQWRAMAAAEAVNPDSPLSDTPLSHTATRGTGAPEAAVREVA